MQVLFKIWGYIYDFLHSIATNFYQSVIYDNRYQFILEGLYHTILIAFFAIIIGITLGLIITIIRDYNAKTGKLKIPSKLCKWYVDVIRGTPVILQLMIIYYVIFKSVDINIIIVGIIAFGLNSSAYVSEIIRGGLNSIPKGQIEAGYSLGFQYGQVTRYIVLPQTIKNILPALGNEFITLLKETSVGAYIGIIELTKASDIIASRTYDYFFPLLLIAIIYLIMTLGLSKLVAMLERKFANDWN